MDGMQWIVFILSFFEKFGKIEKFEFFNKFFIIIEQYVN
jgi:hypothetical protein